MSNEHNIDDMLRMLKSSVYTQQESSPQQAPQGADSELTDDALKEQLRSRYFNEETASSSEEDSAIGEYAIDSDFLNDVENMKEEEPIQEQTLEKTEEEAVDDAITSENFEENIAENIVELEESEEDTVENVIELEESEEDIDENAIGLEESAETELSVEPKADDVPFDIDDEPIRSDDISLLGNETFIFDDFTLVPTKDESMEELSNEDSESEQQDPVWFEDTDVYGDRSFMFDDDHAESQEEGLISADENGSEYDVLVIDTNEPLFGDTHVDKQPELEDDISEEESIEADELLSVEDIDEFEAFDEPSLTEIPEIDAPIESEEETAPEEVKETFIASMRKIGVDFSSERAETTVEASTADVDVTEKPDDIIEEPQSADTDDQELSEDLRDEELDYSTINLMMQFCEKDELDKTIGDEKIEDYLRYEQGAITEEKIASVGFKGEEYTDKEQNGSINERYKHARFVALARLCGCAFIAIIATVFELIPMLGIRVGGLLDYNLYPSVYVLFGLQFIAFSAAICYKQLWQGLKRAVSASPSKDSIVAVVVVLTSIYDVIIAIILVVKGDDLPSTFNAVAVITVTLSAAAEYIRILAEMRSFSVYSTDAQMFTLTKESARGRVSSKMYAGGLPIQKSVCSIRAIDFPRGFFKCVGMNKGRDKIITYALIPVLVVSLIATIITIVLGAGPYDACAVFLLTIYAVLPIAYIYSNNFPSAIATLKLAKRGSAIAGDEMVRKYNDCDVMIFEDRHMFRKCKTEEVGIAIYDNSIAYLTLGCIDALYSKLGGPLSGMQMQLPDVFKFNDVDIQRITRNGVEAVVDKKHVVIVGDIEFMKRYGLVFPENEVHNDRSTLCVSIDGGVSAKLSVKYETEPVFEMIVERLYSEGILSAIETYDPLINSTMLKKARTLGDTPVSVIHMNSDDFLTKEISDFRKDLDGIVSCSSKLKLAEAEVWIKRRSKMDKMLKAVTIGFSAGGALLVTLFVALGIVGAINQFHMLAFILAQIAVATALMLWKFPKKNYFTTDKLYFELEKRHNREMKKQEKKNKNETRKQ